MLVTKENIHSKNTIQYFVAFGNFEHFVYFLHWEKHLVQKLENKLKPNIFIQYFKCICFGQIQYRASYEKTEIEVITTPFHASRQESI